MKRLDELPSANLTLAVLREIDGCNEPVVVRYGYGSGFEPLKSPEAETPRLPKAKLYR
jgi:hypothetical protein